MFAPTAAAAAVYVFAIAHYNIYVHCIYTYYTYIIIIISGYKMNAQNG